MTKYERIALKKDFYINHEDMCVGDNMHNEYMDILLRDVVMDDFQIAFLNKYLKRDWKTGNWVFDDWTKGELSKINTILCVITRIIRPYKPKLTVCVLSLVVGVG